MINNKLLIKDNSITKEMLESVMVHKEEKSEWEEAKVKYFEKVEDERKTANKYFKNRDYKMCDIHLNEIVNIGSHAYD